ncbi:triacylglycerol lipase [Teladorsagia circumcincta]|uniref:Triacylglycerol lipase n=1 Tax=Teladorsagia circumcincta TaxID=45464 RepID=A0A2G9UXT7_TELCI|nr:triacylglycerol lipase [Teladorsagia circumcincta]
MICGATNLSKFCNLGTKHISIIPAPSTLVNDSFAGGSMSLSFGGRHVRDGEYPWLVTIALKGEGNGCSGALISQRHVLTAAHCARKASIEVPKEEQCKKRKHKNTGKLIAPLKNFTLLIGSQCKELAGCPEFRTRTVSAGRRPIAHRTHLCTARLEYLRNGVDSALNTLGQMSLADLNAPFDGHQVVQIELMKMSNPSWIVTKAQDGVGLCGVKWVAGGYVSKYFYDGFINLWNAGMRDDFETLNADFPGYNIWVTGHSLGAALASLAASYIIANNQIPTDFVQLVTFGQPRVGDIFFSWAHDRQMVYSFRVTHWRDVVPHVPPELFELYYHHKSEVRMALYAKHGERLWIVALLREAL